MTMISERPTQPATWKDSELIAFIESKGQPVPDPFERKEAIRLAAGIISGKVADNIEETKNYIDEMKEKDPGLELMKVIFHSRGEEDLPYVQVGLNGSFFYLPQEMEIEVPKVIMNSCIKDAVEDRLMPVTEMDGTINWIKRKVQRFPYTIVNL